MPAKKKGAIPESSSSESEEEQFQVEVIAKARVDKNLNWEYYVKWAGFGEDADSWEPFENVEACDRLLKSFWSHVGLDNNDYSVGYVAEATDEWIAKEKRYFARNLSEDAPPKKPKDGIAFTTRAPASPSSSRKKSTQRKSKSADAEDSDDVSLASFTKTKKRAKSSDTESDSSDDKPLRKTRKTSIANLKREASIGSKVNSKSSTGAKNKSLTPGASSGKGKERAHTPPLPPPPTSSGGPTSPHSLFSAPTSPAAASNKQPLPAESTSAQPTQEAPAQEPAKKPSILKPLPTHIERKMKPKIVMMDLPTQNANVGKGISTKQRLSMSSAAAPSPITPQLPNATAQKSALSKLSFTKKASSQDTRSPVSPQIQSAGSASGSGFNFGRRESTFAEGGLVQSPASMHNDDFMQVDNEAPSYSEPLAPPPPPIPRRSSSTHQASIGSMTLADAFLNAVIPSMASPMHESTAANENRPAPAPAIRTIGRIQKKWKWEGELYVESGPDVARHLCNITFTEITEPRHQGLQLRICFSQQANIQSIRFKKLHDVSDIYLVVPACIPVQQFCKISAQGEGDSPALKTLEAYMRKKRMFTYAIAYDDSIPNGLLIVFPSALNDLCDLFLLPQDLRQSNGLVLALCSWTLYESDIKALSWVPAKSTLPLDTPLLDSKYAAMLHHGGRKLVAKPLYYRGLRILKFPQYLHDFMSQQNRPYCVWYGQTPTNNTADLETASLQAILETCGAKDVGLKTDVRAVFIHVGSLSTVYKVPSMWARRSKRPELRFFTYGTHENVPPERWGVREVYPIGGVATFTSTAILENPTGVCRLIEMLDRHPLWTCFITPVAIGGAAKATSKGSDPLALFDRKESICTTLLTLIEDGKVSLMTSPPQQRHPMRNNSDTGWVDAEMAWISGQFSLLGMQGRDMLEACMRSFNSVHANTPEGDLNAAVGKDVVKEMNGMQFQPVMMDGYRRFVVIKGAKDPLEDKREILEVVALSGFEFKDDFFMAKKGDS